MASDEALDEDPDAYSDAQCEGCAVRQAIEDLDAPNRDAWSLYRQIVTRFTVDAQVVPLALSRLTADRDPDAFAELLDRFAVLYDALSPPKEQSE